ncbi:MAG TPA: circularly permuted type 2 ATP-grasp protein [Propionibacteriaceae bacterium]|nr:circularly permuted type 2 ATP-grasp protein [Propionibacteriaceae bacterium]HPZ48609.1 circularly permuted type 2 ATP-grasp protein [Propionibacteriaceae bacterium]
MAWLDDYSVREGTYDEVLTHARDVRPAYAGMLEVLSRIDGDDLGARVEFLRRTYLDQGVTFDIGGQETPFPLDIVPRVIEPADWVVVETGVAQRVRALEAFLADVYGQGKVFDDGVVPRRIITTSSHFHRAVVGLEPHQGVRIHVAGVDLIRDGEGRFRVLEDNVRVPSGVSYVLTNRRAITAALPEVAAAHRVRPVQAYASRLRRALAATAPRGVTDPTIVVMTPGVHNSAYFEHALLARMMGCELVEGRDLVCANGVVSVRTTRGLRPVHVIYRRVDDDYLDPAHFRPDSLLGVAGLLNAARAGNVTIANAVGNGVADDKLVYTYVSDLIRYYLAEEPILPSVDTWRLEEPEHRVEVLDRLEELVVKPVDGSGGKGIVIGPASTRAQLDQLRERILADPRGWIAQPVVQLSTVPTMIDGRLAPRHVDLRPFAVNDGSEVWVLPGGLTRVALPEGELIVNSSQGGGSKDTWVLADGAVDTPEDLAPAAIPDAVGLVVQPDHHLRTEHTPQQEQQQQHRQAHAEEAPC